MVGKRVYITLLLIAACLSCTAAWSGDKPVIEWKVFYIQAIYNKPGTGEGFADELFRFYRDHLPEYTHDAADMPIKRIFHDMANITTGMYCCPGKTPLAPEDMARVIPSNSAMELAPPGIVVRTADIGTLFPRDGVISVAQLIEKDGLRTSWVRGATYHPQIREVIERNEQLPNVTMQATVIGEFQEMLLREHIDFYVSHALDFTWHQKNNPVVAANLSFLAVTEAQDTVSTLAICNITPESRELIGKINTLIETDEFVQFREDLIRRYYPPSLVEHYLALHRKGLPRYDQPR